MYDFKAPKKDELILYIIIVLIGIIIINILET